MKRVAAMLMFAVVLIVAVTMILRHGRPHATLAEQQAISAVGAPAPLLRGLSDPVTSGYICNSSLDGVQYLNQTASTIVTCNGTTSTWFSGIPYIATGSVPISALATSTTTINGTVCTLGGSCAPTSPGYVKGTSGTITGTLLAVGGVDSGSVSIAGSTVGERCGSVTTTDGTNPSSSVTLSCRVATAGTVTVEVTAEAVGTPASKSYNFVLFP